MPNKEDVEVVVAPDQVGEKTNIGTDKNPVFVIRKRKGTVFEFEDVLFHLNSAVPMPSVPKGPSSEDDEKASKEQEAKSGFEVYKAVLIYAKRNPDKRLIIAGHTDRSGEAKYNFDLSELRTQAVLSILLGHKTKEDGDPNWVETVSQKHKVEDYQQILTHIADRYGWTCDPEGIDNDHGKKTGRAVENFQIIYNRKFGKNIGVDGKVGPQTWGAIYDMYEKELAELLDEKDVSGLGDWRSALKWVDDNHRNLPCGESIPLSTAHDDDLKSQTDRRVEFAFFDKDKLPVINCPPSGQDPHPVEKCPLYNPAWVRYHLPVQRLMDIKIIEIDDHFAPGAESISIKYEVKGLVPDNAKLRVTSDHYDKNPIFERPLTAEEKTDGVHQIAEFWDGQANCKEGALKDGKYVNPLYAPYKLQIVSSDGKAKDDKEFKVLYAGITLERGPWLSDGTVPKKPDYSDTAKLRTWLRYKLNEFGYYGGPFTTEGAETALQRQYLNRAIKLYKCRCGKVLRNRINDSGVQTQIDNNPRNNSIYDSIDDDPRQFDDLMLEEIDKGNGKRAYMTGDTKAVFGDETKSAKLFVPSLYYQKSQQFGAGGESRFNFDDDYLNDPCVPMLAKILIKDKKDKAVSAPQAVGAARIQWHIEDPPEPNMGTSTTFGRYRIFVRHDDDNTKPTQDAHRLNYMQAVQNWISGTANVKYSDDTPFAKNCPPTNGGKNDLTTIFIDYHPFKATVVDKRPTTTASVDTAASKVDIWGKAGVNCSFSRMGGDSFRVVADLTFKDLPNEDDLKKLHNTDAKGVTSCQSKSGVFTIWRDDSFARIVAWPGVPFAQYLLPRIRQNYEQCYVDMTVPAAGDVVDITSVINDSEYRELISVFQPKKLMKRTTFTDGSTHTPGMMSVDQDDQERITDHATPGRTWIFWHKFKLTKDCLYGRDLPPQKDMKGSDYQKAIQSLFYDRLNGFVYKVSRPMARLVVNKLRPDVPSGHIIVAFYPHKPITIKKNTGANPNAPHQTNWRAGFVSMGLSDGLVTYDLSDNDRRDYVITHEFGHHNFLYHTFHDSAGDDNPKHHDTTDDNTIMSYPTGTVPKIGGQFNPLYCGKCNLRLRGWKIVQNPPVSTSGLPAHS